ncbi:sortase domain-containing protein [Streptomyces eurythermus]
MPVAEGVDRAGVLNKGYAGHYRGTRQPGRAGNFALAGHRDTHGEPFRYLPRLRRGDTVEVETRSATYTYGDEPGHCLTLTTRTPEFTSRYRLVVWAKPVSVRPR